MNLVINTTLTVSSYKKVSWELQRGRLGCHYSILVSWGSPYFLTTPFHFFGIASRCRLEHSIENPKEKPGRCLPHGPKLFSSIFPEFDRDVHCHLGTLPWVGQIQAISRRFLTRHWQLAAESFPCRLRWQLFSYPFLSPLNWSKCCRHFSIYKKNHVFLCLSHRSCSWAEPWYAATYLIMMPWASYPNLLFILRNPNHTSHSAALWTFQWVAYVNYPLLPLSSCCPRMFFFSLPSSVNNEIVLTIYIFYS